ncbi:hypothetical protein [Spirochaeta lutea]|uniref:Uncharacterized protein n=1 Tax=Spirochaeta lutea TaxID=1480694 RepID=A0A098QWT8_9SPIO|nr:hypothetical protein [Spirochaeta lutea]KGE71843.1 hypothetical protein DC28_08410 [Spirochaeta lutea]
MEQSQDFLTTLQGAVQQKYAHTANITVPKLKENFHSLESNFRSLLSLCQRKGILREDPYKKERQISEVQAPRDEMFQESYKEDELAIRLSEFDSQLDFLNHYTSFALETMNLKELKSLVSMVRFIRWTEFSTNSTKPTTRLLAEVLEKIRKGSDSMAAGAVNSSLNQCAKNAKEVTEALKQITNLKREEYKLEIRERILSQWDMGTAMPHDLFIKEVKRAYTGAGFIQPFYGELVEEIYQEDFDESREDFRKKVFSRLEVPQRQVAEPVKQDVLKEMLLDALRALGNASRHLEISVQKLKENSAILENRPRSFMERFREWIIQLSSGKAKDIVYEVEFIDITTSAHTTRQIQFSSFIANLDRKARLLTGIINKQSSAYQKLRMADEDQLYTLLEKNLSDLIEIHKNLDALDTFFKSEVSRLNRDQIRGIKNELSAIKNNIHQASQRKHEYIAKREEIEQLRKLGISPVSGGSTGSPGAPSSSGTAPPTGPPV